jgi:YHS domain-containing protein
MIRLLFLFLLGYGVYLFFRTSIKKMSPPAGKPDGEIVYKDPVCGVYVTEKDAVVGKLEGEKIYFCSMECLEKYRDRLEKKS